MANTDGCKVTALIVAVFYIAMALAALIVEFLFSLLLIPQHRSAQIVETTISLNYTTMLNVIFLAIAAFLVVGFFEPVARKCWRTWTEQLKSGADRK